MATVTIRLDDATRDRLEQLAEGRGTNISMLLRDQIDLLLGRRAREEGARIAPLSIGVIEREILARLHKIQAWLLADDESERQHHQHLARIFEEGYTAEYMDAFISVQKELSISECEHIWDLLDMFTVLRASIAKVSPRELEGLGPAVSLLQFDGFDFNDTEESRIIGYMEHLFQQGRWENIAERLNELSDGGNSHHKLLPAYERMYAAYKPLWDARIVSNRYSPDALRLSVEELAEVGAAAIHPDGRD